MIKIAKHSVHLVSDDDKNGAWEANQGVTLPNGENATYNISLSPLFVNHSGAKTSTQPENLAIIWYGRIGHLWSKTIYDTTQSYRIGFNVTVVNASNISSRFFGHPLRCLVSTNNR